MKENLTRKVLNCRKCNEPFIALDTSGYCESCYIPDWDNEGNVYATKPKFHTGRNGIQPDSGEDGN